MTNPATNLVTIKYIEEDERRYAVRNGYRFEIGNLELDRQPETKRKAFEPEFAKLPFHWTQALKGANGATYELAIAIQLEVFQCERMGGEIVLSTEMTGISHSNRYRAALELEQLGLIKLSRKGNQALRVRHPMNFIDSI